MPELFEMKSRDLKKLVKLYKAAPMQFRRAAAMTLNSFAFGSRKAGIGVINAKMTVRSTAFIGSVIRVEKTSSNIPIQSMVSAFGSIAKDRFSGLIEQETGQVSNKTRTATLLGRGGDKTKTLRPRLRLKPSIDHITPDDFPGDSDTNRVIAMLNHIMRTNERRAFVIKGHKSFRRGLYVRKRKEIKRVQTFRRTPIKPTRVRWSTEGRNNYFRANPPASVWAESISRAFKLKVA